MTVLRPSLPPLSSTRRRMRDIAGLSLQLVDGIEHRSGDDRTRRLAGVERVDRLARQEGAHQRRSIDAGQRLPELRLAGVAQAAAFDRPRLHRLLALGAAV